MGVEKDYRFDYFDSWEKDLVEEEEEEEEEEDDIIDVTNIDSVEGAIDAGMMDANFDFLADNGSTYTLLGYAISARNVDMVRMLIRHGADIERPGLRAEDMVEALPLEIAAENQDVDIMRILLQAGAKTDNDSLFISIRHGNPTIVKLLLEAGSDANYPQDEEFPLFMCDLKTNPGRAMFKVLVEFGANIDAVDYQGNTIMMRAAETEPLDVIRFLERQRLPLLLEYQNQDGDTILDYAALNPHAETREYFARMK